MYFTRLDNTNRIVNTLVILQYYYIFYCSVFDVELVELFISVSIKEQTFFHVHRNIQSRSYFQMKSIVFFNYHHCRGYTPTILNHAYILCPPK